MINGPITGFTASPLSGRKRFLKFYRNRIKAHIKTPFKYFGEILVMSHMG